MVWIQNRNRNISIVGTGTAINRYRTPTVPQHCILVLDNFYAACN